MTRKELKVKYKNSVLGFVWSLLNPATSIVVFFFVFQIVLNNGIPGFAVLLIAGILPWNLFSSALPAACVSVVANAGIVKKVAFPREILPLASVGAALVHFFLQLIVLIVFLGVFQRGPAIAYLPLLIPALLTVLLLTGALGVLLAAVNVHLRDMQHLLEIGLQVWFWATPIVYAFRMVSDRFTGAGHHGLNWLFVLYRMNPMTPIVLTFQRALYGATSPVGAGGNPVHILPDHAGLWWYFWQLLAVCSFSILLFAVALMIFGRLEGSFAEDL
jgi:ABC-2 type transport system permease protein